MRLSWVRPDPKANNDSIEEKEKETNTETHKEAGHVRTRSDFCGAGVPGCGSTNQKLEVARRHSPFRPLEIAGPCQELDSGLRNCERMHFYYFKPWPFVAAALRNEYIHKIMMLEDNKQM